jgi:ribosomal protein S20
MANNQQARKGSPKVANTRRSEHRRVRYLSRLRDRITNFERMRKNGELTDKGMVKLDKAYRLLDGNKTKR